MRFLRAALLAIGLASAAPAGLWIACPSAAQAQETVLPDYAKWEMDALQAEQVLEEDRASTKALEQMRKRIVDWRSQFSAAKTSNEARITTLKSQIAALGAPPAEGVTEAPEIATRRAELGGQLAKLQVPGLAAEEAFSRAEGIIREVDTKIRSRQATALLKLSPSPANPINWPAGGAVLTQGARILWTETTEAWANPARRTVLNDNLPAILFYIFVAGLLVLRGPAFIEKLVQRLRRSRSMRARDIGSFLVSFGQVILPVLGVWMLVKAGISTGMTGQRSAALVGVLPGAAAAFFLSRWLGQTVFSGGTGALAVVERPAEARFHTTMIGLACAVEIIRAGFASDVRPPLSLAAQSVWAFPTVVWVAIFVFRLGQILRRRKSDGSGSEARAFHARVQGFCGTAVVVASVLAPLLGVVGYVTAANALIWPTVGTLAGLAILMILHRFLTDIYLLATGSGEEGREALIPTLIAVALGIGALPLLARVWGVREAALTEAWTRFKEGLVVGETRISPTSLLTLVMVFAAGYMITRLIQGAMKSAILPRTQLDKGVQNALTAGLGYVGIFLAALVAVNAAGLDLTSLALVAGALSVGIGFGLQNIVQNFVSGIILLIERPISEGDMIEVNGQFGTVKGISVRSTWIETFDRTDVIVPNGDLVAGVVTNLTRGNLTGRLIVKVGVAYGSDTRRIEAILREIAEAQPLVLVDPPPGVVFTSFGADSLNFEVRVILSDVNFKNHVLSEINHEIVRRFAEEGIKIPYAQRDIWIRNPEALQAGATTEDVPRPLRAPVAPRPAADPRLIHNDPSDEDDPR